MAKKAQPRKKKTASPRGSSAAKTVRAAKNAKKKQKKKTATARKQQPARKEAAARRQADRAAEARRRESLKAVGIYEKALHALQRRRLGPAAALFRKLIDEFPDERELHERSRRYLQVCERQLAPAPTPETLEEQVYAATLALNNGATQDALAHLEAAAAREPDSEQVQYMLAVARAATGDGPTAVTHLHRAIELNPDNRFLARHEPSFEALQENEAFRQMVATPDDGSPEDRSTP